MCTVGVDSAVHLVMSNEHHYGMGAFSQEIHEGLNADCKNYCSNNNIPNIHWVPKSSDFFDLKFIGPVYVDTIDWKARERLFDTKQHLLWREGISDRKWREAHEKLTPKCKEWYKHIREMQAGDEPSSKIINEMNRNGSQISQSNQQISNVHDGVEFIQNNDNMSQPMQHVSTPTKKTRQAFFKQLMTQSQDNDFFE